MHTVKLHIEDKVFDKVIYFLKNLPKNEVFIEEDNIREYSLTELYKDKIETKSFSNYSANLIEEWKDSSEDNIWK